MARATFVKKARKDNKAAGINKGESYYWWSFRNGRSSRKCYSKTPPRRSQLTQSGFLSTMYDAEDTLGEELKAFHDSHDFNALADALRTAAGEIETAGSECQNNCDNMEAAFPNGCPTIELLQGRIEACERITQELEDAASTIENLDPGEPEETNEDDDGEIGEELQNALDEADAVVEGVDWSCE